MKTVYCDHCAKETTHQRQLGFPFWLGVLLTFGLWLLTIPIKPLRCTECGTEQLRKSSRFTRMESTPYDTWE